MLKEFSPGAASPHAPAPAGAAAAATASISPWRAAALVHRAGTPGSLRHRAKFLVRSLSHPLLTRAWVARLIQPDLAPLWAARPRLASKLQRPYVHCEWRTIERSAALMGHYDALPRIFAPEARAAIYDRGLTLIRLLHAGSGRQLDVRLSYLDQFEKEGELTLAIDDVATGLNLAGLTFCLAQNAGQRIAIVGGLQASPDPRTRGLIHDVAKEMHGLRPKALALWFLQELGACWQIAQLQAVGDDDHIYRHWRKRREFAASYNEFWTECDGRRLPGGGWELPLQTRPRTREELKPSRRKAHERRYAMFAALRPLLVSAARALAPGGTPAKIERAEFIYSTRETPAPPAQAKQNPSGSSDSEEPVPAPSGVHVPDHSF